MTASPSTKGSNTGRNIAIVVLVIVVAVLFFLYYLSSFGLGPTRPSSVMVTGSASTKQLGTHAINIGFTSDNGQVFNAAIVNGMYSIALPNDHMYTVQIGWAGALGSSGTCNAGTLNVSVGPGSSTLTNNWTC
jgi:hypothetical protein